MAGDSVVMIEKLVELKHSQTYKAIDFSKKFSHALFRMRQILRYGHNASWRKLRTAQMHLEKEMRNNFYNGVIGEEAAILSTVELDVLLTGTLTGKVKEELA
jgi:hypothetical protein